MDVQVSVDGENYRGYVDVDGPFKDGGYSVEVENSWGDRCTVYLTKESLLSLIHQVKEAI